MRASFMLLILTLSGCITSSEAPEEAVDTLDSEWAFEYSLNKNDGYSAFLVTLEAQAESVCNAVVEATVSNQDDAVDGFMAIQQGDFVGLITLGDKRDYQINGISIQSAVGFSSDKGVWTMTSGANNLTLQAGESVQWWIITNGLTRLLDIEQGLLIQADCGGSAHLTFENTTDARIVAVQEFGGGVVGHDDNARQDFGFSVLGQQTFHSEEEHVMLGFSLERAEARAGKIVLRTPIQEVERDLAGSDPRWMLLEDGPGSYAVDLNMVTATRGSSFVAWSSFHDYATYTV